MSYQSVIRIFATTQSKDHDSPWQSRAPSRGTGSGVVIGRNLILTGAHVVANATFIQVQRVSNPHKAIAKVETICHDADLALLSVEEDNFLSDIEPEALGPLPSLRDRVSVVGYPVGGEEISVTEGVVSRIELQRYRHSERSLLAITVDAAINKGNSGGPVFKDNKVVGVAFQTLKDAENVGELVPSTIIQQFLTGWERGNPPLIPGLGIKIQNLENPFLRQQVGLSAEQTGVLVAAIEYGSTAYGPLQVGDALLEVNGYRVANNGTIQYKNRLRTHYGAILGDHYVGEQLPLTILRDGKLLKQTATLQPLTHLIPRWSYNKPPTYFIYGGMVFQVLTLDFLATWGNWWENAPPDFLTYYYGGIRTEAQQQMIILTQVLADQLNVGYENLSNETIASVNGQKPKNMLDFISLVENAGDVLEIKTRSRTRIVVDPKNATLANTRILKRYHITSDRSPSLKTQSPE